jgi:ABC-type lipoprotein export system ATPase subunit
VFINRLHFRDVKPLNLDIPEEGDELSWPARKRLLIQGGNGSGKTTLLDSIASLWQFWGEWIDVGDGKAPPKYQLKHYLASARFVAMEVHEIAPTMRPLWICISGPLGWSRLRNAYPDHAFTGLEHVGHSWSLILASESNLDLKTLRNQALLGTRPSLVVPGRPIEVSSARPQVIESAPIPNVVYFPSENRTIQRQRQPRAVLLDSIPYNWVARFDQKLNLDSVILTLKTRQPNQFEECLKFVNLALSHRRKRITGFGENGRLVVEGETGAGPTFQHPIEELSSGEKQILLMIGFTTAFLRPGGILLLDEPDLHIHVSMVAQLMETLQLICDEREAQLIVASHSSLVWDWFDEEERIDLSGWREAEQ